MSTSGVLTSFPRRLPRIFILVLVYALAGGDASRKPEDQIERWLYDTYASEDFAGGRLAGMPYGKPSGATSKAGMNSAAALTFEQENESVHHRRLLGLIYAMDGQLLRAEGMLRELALAAPRSAAIQNDLGAVLMAAAANEPLSWFRAIQHFKLASAADPHLAEPRFNLILVYRRLGLRTLETAAMKEYRKVEPKSDWDAALQEQGGIPALDLESWRNDIQRMSSDEIAAAVGRNPQDSRKLVLDYAFRPTLPIPANYQRIAQELSERYGDDTARLALSPISTDHFADVASARALVETARSLYLRGSLAESRETYARAKNLVNRTDSVFDQLWVDVNSADTMTRMVDYAGAIAALQRVVETSRAYRLQWLLARALSAYGSSNALSGKLLDTLSRLNEAVFTYRAIGEARESARALYYLAVSNYMAGNFEESLKIAIESISIADSTDHIRVGQLQWLLGSILYRLGYPEMAVSFNEDALDHLQKGGNPAVVSATSAQLASLYDMNKQHDKAIDQLRQAEETIQQIPAGNDRTITELSVNLIRGRMLFSARDFSRAEQALRKNVDSYSTKRLILGTHVHAQSRLFLAKTLAAQGRTEESAQEFRRALSIVESDQDYLTNINLQVAFDQDRRELYESAIAFEYDRGGCEEPWNLLQGYKAKLFLELLGKFGTPVHRLEAAGLTLSRVQSRIPDDVQIIDYALLRDRLLTWVISKGQFQCQSISLNRYQLQKRLEFFIKQLEARQPIEEPSRDLYDLLAEPISGLLDPRKTLVIIPDGILHRLPFSSLRSRKDGRYWIEKMPILESPSISYFLSESTSTSTNRYIAFGARTYDVLVNKELTTLREIAPDMKVHEGPEVTKEAFLKAMHVNSIFYYAGHSAFDVKQPLQSLILLDGDKRGPNSVSALDIIEQQMVDDGIVILSACDTSLGNFTDGPGIRGLTSAFLVAGAGSVVGSVWPVESSNTSALMVRLFGSLVQERKSVAESLQSAQIELIRNSSHPYYWGGFVVTGNLSAATRGRLMLKTSS